MSDCLWKPAAFILLYVNLSATAKKECTGISSEVAFCFQFFDFCYFLAHVVIGTTAFVHFAIFNCKESLRNCNIVIIVLFNNFAYLD